MEGDAGDTAIDCSVAEELIVRVPRLVIVPAALLTTTSNFAPLSHLS